MILASASPRRRQLLEEAGLSPTVVPAQADETPLPDESPTQLVERLACLKAHASLAAESPARGEIVLGADTIVWRDGIALGKPSSDEDARSTLRRLSGRRHHVSTGVCVALAGLGGTVAAEESFVRTTEVLFRELSEDEIDAYVASGEPRDKAGSYGIQGLGRLLVSKIDGDYFNVVGLPVTDTVLAIQRVRGRSGAAEFLRGETR